MTANIEIHLNEKQIVQAIVDVTDLPMSLQKHLRSCLECSRGKIQFERQIEQLGHQAASNVPLPKHRIFLLLEKIQHRRKWFGQWRSSFGLMATALLVFCISWGAYLMRQSPEDHIRRSVMGTQEAEALIMEVNVLAENALPKVYLELSKEIEADSDSEDIFHEYIIPLTEEDSLSLKSDKKGAASC